MKKFRNKYRSESHRRPNWDYSADGLYFLTFVVQDRKCLLGEIKSAQMYLSDFGEIVYTEFLKSFDIRKELFLDEYVIMPNHMHMIVEIRNDAVDSHGVVDTHGRAYLRDNGQPYQPHEPIKRNMPVRLPKSISSFVAGFKSSVNTQIDNYIDEHQLPMEKYNKNNHFFQSNYNDHIIRNENEYQRIKYYIINNPKNWDDDQLK